jgi:hypothetical protein
VNEVTRKFFLLGPILIVLTFLINKYPYVFDVIRKKGNEKEESRKKKKKEKRMKSDY